MIEDRREDDAVRRLAAFAECPGRRGLQTLAREASVLASSKPVLERPLDRTGRTTSPDAALLRGIVLVLAGQAASAQELLAERIAADPSDLRAATSSAAPC